MNALRVTTVAGEKNLVRYVEASLCFFKAFTFVNVLNATSNVQRKVFFFLETQRNTSITETPANFRHDYLKLQ